MMTYEQLINRFPFIGFERKNLNSVMSPPFYHTKTFKATFLCLRIQTKLGVGDIFNSLDLGCVSHFSIAVTNT
jgi:hypothetical protein